jgi:hypothetical protein
MGYVIIGETIFGDPEEGSTKALAELDVRCDFCNRPAPKELSASYYVCPACHVVK